jgi:hypothetical protein
MAPTALPYFDELNAGSSARRVRHFLDAPKPRPVQNLCTESHVVKQSFSVRKRAFAVLGTQAPSISDPGWKFMHTEASRIEQLLTI